MIFFRSLIPSYEFFRLKSSVRCLRLSDVFFHLIAVLQFAVYYQNHFVTREGSYLMLCRLCYEIVSHFLYVHINVAVFIGLLLKDAMIAIVVTD